MLGKFCGPTVSYVDYYIRGVVDGLGKIEQLHNEFDSKITLRHSRAYCVD